MDARSKDHGEINSSANSSGEEEQVPNLDDKFNAAAFKYFIQPPNESKPHFIPHVLTLTIEFIDQTFEKLIMPHENTLSTILQFRYTMETFTDAQMQLYFKYMSLIPLE